MRDIMKKKLTLLTLLLTTLFAMQAQALPKKQALSGGIEMHEEPETSSQSDATMDYQTKLKKIITLYLRPRKDELELGGLGG